MTFERPQILSLPSVLLNTLPPGVPSMMHLGGWLFVMLIRTEAVLGPRIETARSGFLSC